MIYYMKGFDVVWLYFGVIESQAVALSCLCAGVSLSARPAEDQQSVEFTGSALVG